MSQARQNSLGGGGRIASDLRAASTGPQSVRAQLGVWGGGSKKGRIEAKQNWDVVRACRRQGV